ncbi:quinolinate synthase [Flavobacteriaceae bacterium UJ101]|nr:quinolinate synthase [Flavobacteriaceae bacterium UJ101]
METLDKAKSALAHKGYLDLDTKGINYVEEINKLKKEKNAVILAHYYQTGDIQEIADYLGDSLYLAQQAAKTEADMIVFAGVHFMAETAKILNPHKKVVLPDLLAGCSLADSCPPKDFAAFKAQHPNAVVVTYINCSAGIKALSDIVCTSSNAKKIIESIPKDKEIIFAPDKNLGAWLIKETGRDMILWDGACIVHEAFSLERIAELMVKHPNAKLIAHPESEAPILNAAAFIGSTSQLLKFVQEDPNEEFIVATEEGILYEMQKRAPGKKLIPAPPQDESCACSECFYMKRNTMEKLYLCMKYELPDIEVEEKLAAEAIKPIERMLELSK